MKTVKRIIIGISIISIFVMGDFFFKVYLTSLPDGLDIVSKVSLFPFDESINYNSNIPYKNGNAILSIIESGDKKTLMVINPNQNDYFELSLPKFNRVLFSSNGSQNKHPQIIMWDDLFELTYSGALLTDNPIYELNLYKIIDGKIVIQEKIQSEFFSWPEQMNNEGVIVTVLDSDRTNLRRHMTLVQFHNADGKNISQLDVNFQQYKHETPMVLTNNYLIFQYPKELDNKTISVYSLKNKNINTYTINKPICIDSILSGQYDIQDDNFAWIDCVDNKTINIFDTNSGTLIQIATDGFEKSFLAINNMYLLWVSKTEDNPEKSNIYGKDLKTGEEFLVAENMFNVSKPILFNDYVYWSSIVPTMIADQRYVFRKNIGSK